MTAFAPALHEGPGRRESETRGAARHQRDLARDPHPCSLPVGVAGQPTVALLRPGPDGGTMRRVRPRSARPRGNGPVGRRRPHACRVPDWTSHEPRHHQPHRHALDTVQLADADRGTATRVGRTRPRSTRHCGCSRPSRRWCSPARRARCAPTSPASPQARPSCCREETAPRPSPPSAPTPSATSSRCCCRMAVVLTYGAQLPVVKVGRIAGQFAKPRSSTFEHKDGVTLPAYRGDAVNALDFSAEARVPDPDRLVRCYHQAAATLNLLRAFTRGGFADLTEVHTWNQEFVAHSPQGRHYEQVAAEITRALGFIRACGVDVDGDPAFQMVDFRTSHEALLLGYEEALTPAGTLSPATGTTAAPHMLWAGERTRDPDGAHIHFLSGVGNPVGVKLGPTAGMDEVDALVARLNPRQRAGASHADRADGSGARRRTATPPGAWRSRPRIRRGVDVRPDARQHLHQPRGGYKTRRFEDILSELRDVLRRAPRRGHGHTGWRALRADRRGRDGVPSAGRRTSPTSTCRPATSPRATPASTTPRPWSSRSRSPRCCAPPDRELPLSRSSRSRSPRCCAPPDRELPLSRSSRSRSPRCCAPPDRELPLSWSSRSRSPRCCAPPDRELPLSAGWIRDHPPDRRSTQADVPPRRWLLL